MNFFQKIKDSIYSPSFYKQIPKHSLGSAFGYFFLLILLLTALQSIAVFVSWGGVTVLQTTVEKIVTQVSNSYPQELTVSIQNGQVSTNVEEPYFITLPEGETKENLMVIDTKTPFSVTQFRQYNTAAWLTKDSLVFNGTSQIRTIDLANAENMIINKPLVNQIVSRISPWFTIITPAVIVFVLIGIFLYYSTRLLYLLLLAILILILVRILKQKLSYGSAYKIGLYAMTTGFLVELIVWWTPLNGFPFLFSIVTLVIVLLNFLPSQTAKK